MTPSPTAEIVALTSRDLPDAGAPLSDRETALVVRRALQVGTSVNALISDDGELPVEIRRNAEMRLEFTNESQELLELYAESLVWCVTPFDEGWPTRLSDRLELRAPSVLYGVGDRGLLSVDGLGIVGSRNLTSEGEEVARTLGSTAARARIPVISGAARGADRIGMEGAMEAGGQAVGVLAHPLTRTAHERSVVEYIERGQLCLVTQFKPSSGFSVGAAMARNKVIYALSRRTIAVASDHDSGGTWAGATEALRLMPQAVSVWRGPGEGPGNAALAHRGATVIDDLEAAVEAPEPAGQLPLI